MKIRLYEIAKQLNLNNKQIIEDARREGCDVSVPSNAIPMEVAERIRDKYLPRKDASENKPRLHKPRTTQALAKPLTKRKHPGVAAVRATNAFYEKWIAVNGSPTLKVRSLNPEIASWREDGMMIYRLDISSYDTHPSNVLREYAIGRLRIPWERFWDYGCPFPADDVEILSGGEFGNPKQ